MSRDIAANFTIQIGSKKALIVLRVPVSAFRPGKALPSFTRRGHWPEPERDVERRTVTTYLARFSSAAGGPRALLVSHCESDMKKGVIPCGGSQ